MSSGEETFQLPMNREGAAVSLLQPELPSSAGNTTLRRFIRTTSATAAPALATDGISLRGCDEFITLISHDGNGTATGEAIMWVYYSDTTPFWWPVPGTISLGGTIPIDEGSATGWSQADKFDSIGASRVYVQVTTMPGGTTNGVDIWVMGRTVSPTTNARFG